MHTLKLYKINKRHAILSITSAQHITHCLEPHIRHVSELEKEWWVWKIGVQANKTNKNIRHKQVSYQPDVSNYTDNTGAARSQEPSIKWPESDSRRRWPGMMLTNTRAGALERRVGGLPHSHATSPPLLYTLGTDTPRVVAGWVVSILPYARFRSRRCLWTCFIPLDI